MCEVTEFPPPKWGVILKKKGSELYVYYSFRPRNGEVILKEMYRAQFQIYQGAFPSPQWGDCSKDNMCMHPLAMLGFPSPQWGYSRKIYLV